MARDLNIKHGSKIQLFIKRLEELKLVVRTYEIGKGKPTYEVPSRDALLSFFSRFRDMKNEVNKAYQLGIDRNETIRFLSDNGGIMCLTTALQYYDNYFRDETIHVYVKNPTTLLPKVHSQAEGKNKVILYNFDLPDVPEVRESINVTSPIRTIIDLYCNNMSYTAEQFIKKVWT